MGRRPKLTVAQQAEARGDVHSVPRSRNSRAATVWARVRFRGSPLCNEFFQPNRFLLFRYWPHHPNFDGSNFRNALLTTYTEKMGMAYRVYRCWLFYSVGRIIFFLHSANHSPWSRFLLFHSNDNFYNRLSTHRT